MTKTLLIFTFILSVQFGFSNTIVVANTNNTGTGSFRDAVTIAVPGDTIRFNPALLANGNDTIKLASGIFIGKNLVVKGLFTVTDTLFISGQHITYLIGVGFAQSYIGTRNVVLDSLALINGNRGTLYGGGIYVDSRLDILFLRNSLVRNCQAENGGGMYCTTAAASTLKPPLVIVENSTFENNAANNFGGAICTYFAKIRTINSTLKGNTALRGGGIYFHAKYISEIRNTDVRNNSATGYGGGFYSHFTDTVLVKNSSFYGNYAFYNGGAMNSAGKLDVVKTLVDSNSAGTRAGGIYFAYFGTVMTVDSCLITRNNATFGGGVNAQSAMNFNYTTFVENTGSLGAGLYYTSATVNVLGCTFNNNNGSNSGGAIYAGQYGTLNVTKSTIVNNSAVVGGGIYVYTPYSANSLSLTNSTVFNNTATFGSGIYLRTSTTFSLNATFKSSVVAGNGALNISVFNDTITSLGYNVFGDSLIYGTISSDQLNVSDSLLSLRPVGNYGGFIQTSPPNIGSVAINAGNPLDISKAQNRTIIGVRDAGAAEGIGVYHDTLSACTQLIWYGSVYSTSGNYVKTIVVNGNTVTVATLNLTIIAFTTGVDVVTSCSAYTWIDGITYTTSNNTATDTLQNAIGCDSIITLNLTILAPVAGVEVVATCESFTWTNGVTYTANNSSATDTLLSFAGCDSVVTLNLTILPASSGTEIISACDSYTWINGVTYSASNNTATDTLQNALGCDSVVTLNLTILLANSSTDQILTCGEDFTWIDGITYTSNNNTAKDTLVNTQGCDSVVTLNLTIHNVNVAVTVTEPSILAQAAFASYRWLDCDNNFAVIPGATAQIFTATSNGNYAVEITELSCIDTSNCVAITTIGLNEKPAQPEILVYPNPAQSTLHIAQLWPNEEKRISLKNALGQELLVFETTATDASIDVSLLPMGVYFLHIASGNKSHFQKIISSE